ncbi:MAG: hypothetical protein GY778_25220 [bacterium]|nr:hypothetical protein [bacterium]
MGPFAHSVRYSRFVVVVSLHLGLVLSADAGEPVDAEGERAAGELVLTTERVVVFKDGYGLFVKTAVATADAEGRVFTGQVPDGAVLGTFWATADDRTIRAMRAEWVDEQHERTWSSPCISTLDLLRANVGKQMTLGLTNWNAPPVAGKLIEVLDRPPVVDDPPPAGSQRTGAHTSAHSSWRSILQPPQPGQPPLEQVRELVPDGGQLLVIETADGARLVMPVGEVRTVSGEDIETQMTRRELIATHRKRLTFDLGPDAANQPVRLNLMYFAEGVRWIPTYRLDGDLAESGELALQGELLNEAEDIAGAVVDLVVGVPSFRFKTVVSPLALERTLRNSLAAAAPDLMGRSGNQFSNAMFSQRAGESRGHVRSTGAPAGESLLDLAPELAGGGEQDLYVYTAGRLSLNKGARAALPLWRSVIPVHHLYTLDINTVRDSRSGRPHGAAPHDAASPLRLLQTQVWHQLELSNGTDVPWTTGPTLLLRGHLPLGQDLLTYTPPGGRCLLPVTVAMDVRSEYDEQELERTPNALKWNSYQYSLIRKKGTVTVTNYRDDASELHITVGVGGKADEASDDGQIRLDDYRPADWSGNTYGPVNNHSDVTWTFTLPPGESKTLTFEFSFYVR